MLVGERCEIGRGSTWLPFLGKVPNFSLCSLNLDSMFRFARAASPVLISLDARAALLRAPRSASEVFPSFL